MGYFTAQKQRQINSSTKGLNALLMLPFRLAWIIGKMTVGVIGGLIGALLALFGGGSKARKKR